MSPGRRVRKKAVKAFEVLMLGGVKLDPSSVL